MNKIGYNYIANISYFLFQLVLIYIFYKQILLSNQYAESISSLQVWSIHVSLLAFGLAGRLKRVADWLRSSWQESDGAVKSAQRSIQTRIDWNTSGRSLCIVLDSFITLGYFCVQLVSASKSLRLHIRTDVHYLNTIFMPHLFFLQGKRETVSRWTNSANEK